MNKPFRDSIFLYKICKKSKKPAIFKLSRSKKELHCISVPQNNFFHIKTTRFHPKRTSKETSLRRKKKCKVKKLGLHNEYKIENKKKEEKDWKRRMISFGCRESLRKIEKESTSQNKPSPLLLFVWSFSGSRMERGVDGARKKKKKQHCIM